MKNWSYAISIPFALTLTILYWYYLVDAVNTGMFDSLWAWIAGGIACHGALVGISYHAYRTITGTWVRPKKKKK
jgi:prolipoprotein diacylglyceryltransferase